MSQQNPPRSPSVSETSGAEASTSAPNIPRRSISGIEGLPLRVPSVHTTQDSRPTDEASLQCHAPANLTTGSLTQVADSSAAMKAEDFEIGKPIGYGSSAVVYAARYTPLKKRVAIKMIDLDMFERNQIDELRRETALMALSKHPNVLQVYGSFVCGSKLYIVTPYLAGGSCLDIMKTGFPDGFEEAAIATILRQALEGLVYLHKNGHIHRDVKAGNLLMDDHGTVLLADFGVSSSLTENNELRKTFVGTPCWMAPEVMEQAGYDYKADIWSFGITSIELATGHAPFAKYPPMKVLMMTLSNDPPTLDREHTKHKYSKTFKEMIDSCLQKDPAKRPSAEKLLQHPFFKEAKKKDYLVRSILSHVPPLDQRPHKKVPQRHVSFETTEQWDFDTPADNVSDHSGPGEKKRHISFGNVVVRNPSQLHASTTPGSPSMAMVQPSDNATSTASRKSRFVVEEGHENDNYSTELSQRSISPIYEESNIPLSPYIPPVSSTDGNDPPAGLGISASAPLSTEVKRGRFSVNQAQQRPVTPSTLDDPEQQPIKAQSTAQADIRPIPVARTSSQDSFQERKSRFEVQHKGNASNQPPAHGAPEMHVKFENLPISRENSFSPTTYNPSIKSSRFSIGEHQVLSEPVISPECRKKGRFELSGTMNDRPEDTSHSNVSSPITSPCSPVSKDHSAYGLPHALYSHLELLSKQMDAQKTLVQDMMAGLALTSDNRSGQSRTREMKRAITDQDHINRTRSYTSFSAEGYATVDHLQQLLLASNRERDKLAVENESLKREIERLRSLSRKNSTSSTANDN
ncbi:kinase-like domain-containing protein [Dichotomocladium elegans]|nr:kinase-like domain-containing protein [Dichotomocladium elegans]